MKTISRFLLTVVLLVSFCKPSLADDDDGAGAIVALLGLSYGVSALNTGSTIFNVYNMASPKPMGKSSKVLSYASIAAGAAPAAVGIYGLAKGGGDNAFGGALFGSLAGTGVAAVGTGIISLVVDKKQKARALNTVSFTPVVSHDKKSGTSGGLFLSKTF